MSSEILALQLRGIRKTFPGVVACDDVDLKVRVGEVHALLGENGAGKSTLMSILFGLYQADAGEILVMGRPLTIGGPRDARAAGIGMVHQHFKLVGNLTVYENAMLGYRSARYPRLEDAGARQTLKGLVERYRLGAALDDRVEQLDIGRRQKLEIIKAVFHGSRILILDEPTAVLTPAETGELFGNIRRLRESGLTVIFITHKLREVQALADTVTVLRRGRLVASAPIAAVTHERLVEWMVGRRVALGIERPDREPGPEVLTVKDLTVSGSAGLAVDRVSLSVRAGEILGVAGVVGNGQTELADAIVGLVPAHGDIRVGGKPIGSLSTRMRRRGGLSTIPEDRQQEGLVLSMSIAENLCLDDFDVAPLARWGLIDLGQMQRRGRELVARYDVRTPSSRVPVGNLSGGNQQKVVLARALSTRPTLLLALQPTRGLDVGATRFVHGRLMEERQRGCAILLVSADLDEVAALSDRVIVMCAGRIAGEMSAQALDLATVGRWMAGGQGAAL